MEYAKLLRQRDFAALWLAHVISVAGDNVYSLALTWFVLEATNSALQASLVMLFSAVAVLLVGPFAGALVDHWDRKKTLIVSDLVRGAIIMCIPLLHRAELLEIWHIYGATLLLTGASLFFEPARSSILPAIVGKDSLTAANAFFSLATSAIRLISMGIGGVLIANMGAINAIVLNSFSFIISAGFILLAPLVTLQTSARPTSLKPLIQDIQEGIVYVKDREVIFSTMILRTLVNFGTGIFIVLTPVFVKTVLDETAQAYGWLQAAIGLGGLVGALFIVKISKLLTPGQCFAVGCLLAGTLVTLFGLSNYLPICLILIFLAGLTPSIIFIPIDSVIQAAIPEDKRGRVLTMMTIMGNIARPLAFGLAGGIGDLFGARIGIVLSGSVVQIVGLVSIFIPALQRASMKKADEWA